MEKGEAVGDGRAEGLPRRQAAISRMPDDDGMHVRIFQSSLLEDSCVGGLLYQEATSDSFP